MGRFASPPKAARQRTGTTYVVRIVNFAELRASAILVLAPGTLHAASGVWDRLSVEQWVEARLRLAVGQRLPASVQRR